MPAKAPRGNLWLAASAGLVLLTAAIGACGDLVTDPPAAPEVPEEPAPPPPTLPPDSSYAPSIFRAVTCTVTLQDAVVDCGEQQPAPETGGPAGVILGGQNRYIQLASSAAAYNPATQLFTMGVTVRNLIGQPLGTVDGVALDPAGVRVFLANGPLLKTGTGAVTLVAPDGLGDFTGGQQPYFQYNLVLPPFAVTGAKTWTFSAPPTVTAFTFTAYVAASVPFPDGWVDVGVTAFGQLAVPPKTSWTMSAEVRDVVGDPIPGASITWLTSDSTIARVTSDGTVTSVRAGLATITARNGPTRAGTIGVQVSGIRRKWTGAADTVWTNQANWEDLVVPVALDSVWIPAVPNKPALTQNVSVASVQLDDLSSIHLHAFNLTASGDVNAMGTSPITSTTGRLFLSGIVGSVRGTLPRLTVTGSYSLTANITVSQMIRVQGGRLRTSSYRIRQNP